MSQQENITETLIRRIILALLPFLAPIYAAAHNISGYVQSVPSMTPANAGIHFKNLSNDEKYSVFTDINGNFNINIPPGTYEKNIQSIDHRRYQDTMIINKDTSMLIQMIKPRTATSTYFNDDLEVANCLLGGYERRTTGIAGTLKWRPEHMPIRFSTDPNNPIPISTPHRARLDTALADLFAKSSGTARFREAENDSIVNVLFKYLPRMQMPGRHSGWTIVDEFFPDLTPKHMTVLIAKDQPYVIGNDFCRELGRVLRLYNTVPDETFIMYIPGAPYAQRFHPDEGNAIELIYKLKLHTDTRKYKPFKDTTTTNIKGEKEIPEEHKIYQNYPNPFNPLTIVNFQLPIGNYTTLKVFNLLGSEVATLVDEFKEAGFHEVIWDASDVANGVYYYQLRSGDYTKTRKMVLIK